MTAGLRRFPALARRVALGLLLAATISPASPADPQGDTQVFYFGLFTNSSKAIDEKRIERYHDLTSVTKDVVPEMVRLLAVEKLPPHKVRIRNLRLKLVPPKGRPITLDIGGNVYGLGKPHAIGHESLVKLKKLIFSAFPQDWLGNGYRGKIGERP